MRPRKTETSYFTLFWLKDNAALVPFVREVMQICTTAYHPRPKCGRNIHINIKLSQSNISANLIPVCFVFQLMYAHMTACVWRDVIFVLVKCECVWGSVWISSVKTTCTSVSRNTCLSNPTGGFKRNGRKLNGEQDRMREVYNNGR